MGDVGEERREGGHGLRGSEKGQGRGQLELDELENFQRALGDVY